jgi:phage gp45-like
MEILTQNTAIYSEKGQKMVLKNCQFVCTKLVKIAENNDHYIDRRTGKNFLRTYGCKD